MLRTRSLAWFLATAAAGLPLAASVATVVATGGLLLLPEARADETAAAAPGRAAAAVVGALPAGVAARARGDGWTFADERGMTLYTYDRDEGSPGESTCVEACATSWPPLAAPADARPLPNWAPIKRADGSLQWAYRGRPVYRYAADGFPGATFGDGVDTVWRVAFRPIPLPREVGLGKTLLGEVLTDARGLTLYASPDDAPGKTPGCTGDCLRTWQPVAAPWLAQSFGEWSAVARADGSRQWAFKGQPLYRHVVGDYAPGEISGHGVKGWKAVVLEPAPPLPPWATIQSSDAGELVANPQGKTVYAHGQNARGRRVNQVNAKCPDGTCIDEQWVPFIAEAGAKPLGSWTLVDLGDGRRQWAYKGQKLYTNTNDQGPGEFKGVRFGGDRTWSAIMRNGEPMQGVSVGG